MKPTPAWCAAGLPRRRRSPVQNRCGAILVTGTLALASCGDGDDEPSEPTTAPARSVASATTEHDQTPEEDRPEESDPAAEAAVFEATVAAGNVTSSGGRQQVDLGDTVTIPVTSHVADSLHLHGDDVEVQVPAGETAELVFDATIPGVFEAELEDADVPLLELEIS